MELIVVIAILGVLMAVLIPQYIGYVEKSRTAVCNANCATVEREIHIAQMVAEGNFKGTDAEAIFNRSKEEICPSKGTVRMEFNSETKMYVLNCSKHGAHPNQPATDTYYKYEEIYKNYKELGMYLSNDKFREYYFEHKTKVPGQWDAIEANGETLYIQPYIDLVGGDAASKELFVFANTDSTKHGNWTANLIYNHETKQWYAPPDGKSISIVNQSWAAVKQAMTNNNWKPVDVTYK